MRILIVLASRIPNPRDSFESQRTTAMEVSFHGAAVASSDGFHQQVLGKERRLL